MKCMNDEGLAITLQRFNRKERFLVVANALGAGSGILCEGFRKKVAENLGVAVSDTDWWAFDYHIDWFVAALHWHWEQRGEQWPNDPLLVRGQQEDFDLVVVAGENIILIEAKGYTAWGNRQLASKLERLRQLTPGLICEDGQVNRGDRRYKLHFALMSPTQPRKLELPSGLPRWIQDGAGNLRWIKLELENDAPKLLVTRDQSRGTFRVLETS